MGVWYCTREDVKSALDSKESARNDVQIDRAIEAGSRAAEAMLHRFFYPWTGTRYFNWPDRDTHSWRLWLGQHELISVSALVSGGTTIVAADYFLEPVNLGPPYTRIELDLASNASWSAGSTHQRSIGVTGVFGYSADEAPAGSLAEALDTVETGVDVTDSMLVGVGSIIKVGTERMIVTNKTMLDTAQNLIGSMDASKATVSVAVTTGSAYAVGETILLDSERMLIVDIAGNNLTVSRAYDGTVLATHTNSDIYALRTLVVTRGALGTTAAAHNSSDAVTVHVVPTLVRELVIAEAITTLKQQSSGYARTVSAGDAAKETIGRGLADIRDAAYTTYGRKARVMAV